MRNFREASAVRPAESGADKMVKKFRYQENRRPDGRQVSREHWVLEPLDYVLIVLAISAMLLLRWMIQPPVM